MYNNKCVRAHLMGVAYKDLAGINYMLEFRFTKKLVSSL